VWTTLITHFGSPTQAVAIVPYVVILFGVEYADEKMTSALLR
jgi:hypothetical protein